MKNILRYSLFITLILLPSIGVMAQDSTQNTAQHECGNRGIVIASNLYDIGKFIECIQDLNYCVNNGGFEYNEKVQAFRITAMCYLAMDSVKEADKSIERLLAINENYQIDANDPQRFRLELEYIRLQLRANMTSSVSKKMENIELAPATMQIITAKDIQDRGYIDLLSVFSDLPGFDITTDYGISYSILYQRGYRAPALTERTMIMIDGIEDNDLWTNAAFITKQYPVSNIKRVEVIYGPASTIYGANAFCGVINVVTKDEDDLFSSNNGTIGEKPKNAAINLQAGYASYNTKYVDGTLGLRNKNVVFSVTARMYVSDGIDQSSQPYWNGVPIYSKSAYTSKMTMNYSPDSVARYVGKYFQVNSDSTKIVPTTAGIARADSLDKAYYKTALKNASIFKDPINDFSISAKLAVGSFKFGFQYWNKNEGDAGDYVDEYASPNSAYTNWQVREYFAYANYVKKIGERFTLSSLSYYRNCDFGNNSKVATFQGFGNGGVGDYGFISGSASPHYAITNYFENSNEFRSELKGQYVFNDKFDILVGTEFTTGIFQGNYITSSRSPAIFYGVVDSTSGGNNITEYTISGYATGSYKDIAHHINIDLGARVDNNEFRERDGYGTVFNPRVDVIYYPGKFVFKAIYATAFLDASNQNKFSTTTSRIANPTLLPEGVKNYEVSGRYKFGKRNYVEIAGYRAHYTNSLAVVNMTINGKLKNQYQDIGQSLVYGAQMASEIFLWNNISVYANMTYTDPESIFTSSKGADSTVRTGDIAAYSANAGVNIPFLKKLNLNTRLNIVGNKPTGKGSSIASNPYTDVPGYTLLNATLGYKVVKNILLQVGCNNIFNTRYYSPGVRTADGGVYAPLVLQPSRTYMARIIVDLKK